jgi:uncharacterized membrane protein YeaQ/YmgE (transglycosylase-associated protein family)
MLTFNGTVISTTQLLVWLAVALICGIVAEALFGYTRIGLLSATVLGLLGALLGTWIARALHLPALLTLTLFGVQVELIWCTVGAIILIGLLQMFRYRGGGPRPRRRYRRGY